MEIDAWERQASPDNSGYSLTANHTYASDSLLEVRWNRKVETV